MDGLDLSGCVLCMKVESPTGKSTANSSSVIRYASLNLFFYSSQVWIQLTFR